MPKRALPTTRLEIQLEQHAAAPLYKQLYERLRAAILAGRLAPGARLPSTRMLASELGVSRNTTALAYELLLLEGYLQSRVGDGTRVARVQSALPPPSITTDAPRAPAVDRATPATTRSTPGRVQPRDMPLVTPIPEEPPDDAQPGTAVFRVGQPDVAPFPYATWARLVARHARATLPSVARYQPAQGYAPLRAAIAAHIGITRGVRCSAERVILTAGAQGALDLIARTLLAPGERAWVEDPGYPGARGALLGARAELVPVPVDAEGIDVAAGRERDDTARLAVVTPSHQFPTAVTMSLGRRLALLDWSRDADAWIVEDDYDSEFRYSGRPLEALQGLDRDDRVLYVGTFSKSLLPALRLGYVVAPAELVDALLAVRRNVDVHLPLLDQLALAEFMTGGHFARHLRRMRLLYRARREALVDALRAELGDVLAVAVPEAGLHLAAWLPTGHSANRVAAAARARGLRIETFAAHTAYTVHATHDPAREGLLLGFASGSPDALRVGVRTLAAALRAAGV